MSNNNSSNQNNTNSNQGGKTKEGFGTQDTKTRDFERINSSSGSTIKKGNDSQPLTTKKEN